MVDDPLDFSAAHDKKHGPNAEFACRDERGQKWFKFVCSYSDGSNRFNFEIWALNSEDAQRRMVLIVQTGKVDGQLFEQIPA